MEEWKFVDGTDNKYEVSNLGNVRNAQTKCPLKQHNRKGYKYVGYLLNEGKFTMKGVHRLVAKAFPEICGEWFDDCEVHHIDSVPSNNCANNLTVLTKENHRKEKNPDYIWSQKQVYKYDISWKLIKVLNSLSEEYSIYNKKYVLESIERVLPYKGCYLVFAD